MKILITGGTTFVSKYAAEYFVAKGNEVTVINRNSRPQVDGVTHINCDRTALGDRLNGKHFDLILDVTAYTEEHIKTLLDCTARRPTVSATPETSPKSTE
jgi:dTDP-glucose 4,6-dehydratase